ncbi:unnamed protein product [Pleuronectes platessa]|uniref:Uncharacterized protein n=1 Tax=Pleuronectes platessa TaxID=8262 RepID=A0A9N7U439_PLEPL|nr:unnamed protein product [Pleuronectes platessa]
MGGRGGGGDETLVYEVLQPSIYDRPLHVCFSVEWKGGHARLRGAKLSWAKACGGRGNSRGWRRTRWLGFKNSAGPEISKAWQDP